MVDQEAGRPYLIAVTVTMLVEVSDPAVLAEQAGADERASWAEADAAPVQLIQHALHPADMLTDLRGVRFVSGSVEAARAGFRD